MLGLTPPVCVRACVSVRPCVLTLLLLHLHRLDSKWSLAAEAVSQEEADGEADCAYCGETERRKPTMAESKMGPNIQAGAGLLAKRMQKSLNRAQEKVGEGAPLC